MKTAMRLSIFQLDNEYTIMQFSLELGENGIIHAHPQAEKSGKFHYCFDTLLSRTKVCMPKTSLLNRL